MKSITLSPPHSAFTVLLKTIKYMFLFLSYDLTHYPYNIHLLINLEIIEMVVSRWGLDYVLHSFFLA